MSAGFARTKNEEQLLKTVVHVKRDGDMLSESIEEEYGQNLVIRSKSETLLSQADNKYEELDTVIER